MEKNEFPFGSGNNQKWEDAIRETGFGSNLADLDLHSTFLLKQ